MTAGRTYVIRASDRGDGISSKFESYFPIDICRVLSCSDDVKARMQQFHQQRHQPRLLSPPTAAVLLPRPPPLPQPLQQQQQQPPPPNVCKHRGGNKKAVPTIKEQNMAELDPVGFAKILNERLQVVADDRAATERLDRLMTEVRSINIT